MTETVYVPKPPVLARLEMGYANGLVQSYDQGLWSPGYLQLVKNPSVSRPRPAILLDNLTPLGPHQEYRRTSNPVTFVQPSGAYGDYVKYIDWDPSLWASCGFNGILPEPNWQTKLLLAIKDQKVNLAQTLAEYGQAQKMFATNATTIAKTMSALRRGELKKVFNLLGIPRKKLRGTVANRWLELQYGWLPLLSDLHGMVEELQAGLARPRTRKIEIRSVATENGMTRTLWIPQANRYSDMYWNAKTVVKVVCYLRQESLAATRLGITNPVNLAWELLPYSFVIDWFIPIGNWLNAMDAAVGFEGVTGTVTTKQKYVATNDYGGQTLSFKTYSRSVLNGLPTAPLPRWKPSIGWKNVANALSLLSQLKR